MHCLLEYTLFAHLMFSTATLLHRPKMQSQSWCEFCQLCGFVLSTFHPARAFIELYQLLQFPKVGITLLFTLYDLSGTNTLIGAQGGFVPLGNKGKQEKNFIVHISGMSYKYVTELIAKLLYWHETATWGCYSLD